MDGETFMTIEWVIASIVWWYIIGVAIVIHEIRVEEDLTIGGLVMALIIGIGGPLWIVRSVYRLIQSDYVLAKKYPRERKR